MSYYLTEETLRHLWRYKPVPVGQLLQQLIAEGFQIDMYTYQQVFAALSVSFPNGLSISALPDGTNFIEPSHRVLLKQILSPIIVTTADEQLLFTEFFDRFTDWPLKNEGKEDNPSVIDGHSPGNVRVKFRTKTQRYKLFHQINMLTWGVLLAALIAFDLYIIRHLPVRKIIVRQEVGSNPLQRQYTYDDEHFYPTDTLYWHFSDGLMLFKSSPDERISHTFRDTGAYFIRVTRYGMLRFPLNVLLLKSAYVERDSTFSLLQTDNRISTYSVYRPKLRNMSIMPLYYAVFTYDKLQVILILLVLMIVATGIYLFIKKKRARLKLNDGPPLILLLPDHDRHIHPNNYLYIWAQRLVQREESERFNIDIGQTIRRSIQAAGMPTLVYRSILQRSCYIFLVDVTHASSQQIRLCRYFTRFLQTQEVELDLFYFTHSPRVCWNEQSPKGISLDDLSMKYRDRRLVLFTHVENLVNHSTFTLHPWLQPLVNNWQYRALFTYNSPLNWTTIEKALSTQFVLLPITPDGQLKMAEYFQTVTIPPLEMFSDFLSNAKDDPSQQIFATDPDALTPQTIATYLNQYDNKALNTCLFQWACATLIYPDHAWEVTLAIGKEFDRRFLPGKVLTPANLILMTRLPWLQGYAISTQLKESLLQRLLMEYSEAAIFALETLLKDPSLEQLPENSVAYEERKVRLAQLATHSGIMAKRKAGVRQLIPYINTGLIKDPVIISFLRRHIRRRARLRAASFISVLLALSLLGWIWLNKLPGSKLLYKKNFTDSAAYYNNLACDLFRHDIHFSVATTFGAIVNALQRSQQIRSTFQVRYNRLAGIFNHGVAYINKDSRTMRDSTFSQIERRALDSLLYPINRIVNDANYFPDSMTLRSYLKLVSQDPFNPRIRQLILASSQTRQPGEYKPPKLDSLRRLGLFEPFFYAVHASAAQQDSLMDMYSQLALLYKGGHKKIDFTNDSVANANKIQLKYQRAIETIANIISPELMLGASYEDMIAYMYGKGVTPPDYNSLYAAIECKHVKEPIRYYLRYFTDARDAGYYQSNLGNLTFTSNNYVIYFFQYRRLIRQEIRLVLSAQQYVQLLRMLHIDGTMLASDNNFYAENDKWYVAITRPFSKDFTKFIIGQKKTANICSNDWWVGNVPRNLQQR
jgi:hypothetical protein